MSLKKNICIIYSSDIIVSMAEEIALRLHISEKVITMFAIVIGTSLPEMVMTVTSAKKGEFDIAIGNIIGTNIFNICIVLGLPVIIYGNVLLTGFGIIDIIMVFLSSALLFFFAKRSNYYASVICNILYLFVGRRVLRIISFFIAFF